MSFKTLADQKVKFRDYELGFNLFLQLGDDDKIDVFDNPFYEVKAYITEDPEGFQVREPK